MKWFYSELTNKKEKSALVNPLLQKDKTQMVPQVRTPNELMTLCYLSYLETNNYLKSDQKFLFGELVKSTSKQIYQEQVFLFFEMLKVFFPGGDNLVAPSVFNEIEPVFNAGSNKNLVSIRFLSRVFSLLSLEQIGIDVTKKKLS